MTTYISPNQFRDMVEDQLNIWANGISKEYRIPKDTFRINLVNPIPGHYPVIARITNGAVVQIQLTLPWVDKDTEIQSALMNSIKAMKKTVRKLFKYLSNPKLHNDDDLFNPTIISNTVHEYVKGDKGTRTWQRSIFDPHSFSGHRRSDFKVTIEREIRVTVVHKNTKMKYSLTDTNNRPEYDLIRESLEKCVEVIDAHIEDENEKREWDTTLNDGLEDV